jgi:anthranilate synthase component 2
MDGDMILLIDNYDSFVFNLARYFERLGTPTRVVRNDVIDVAEVRRLVPAALVFSPGPCSPREAGASLELVRELQGELPMLGVCLGHQTIAAALGGKIVRAPTPMHGRASRITHVGTGVFSSIPSPLNVGRYHSLTVEEASLPKALRVTARAEDGTIMGLEHRELPLFGMQFHPESILTEHGYVLLGNFLALAGIPVSNPTLPSRELVPPAHSAAELPSRPVTF